jgi:hypothetical protein
MPRGGRPRDPSPWLWSRGRHPSCDTRTRAIDRARGELVANSRRDLVEAPVDVAAEDDQGDVGLAAAPPRSANAGSVTAAAPTADHAAGMSEISAPWD